MRLKYLLPVIGLFLCTALQAKKSKPYLLLGGSGWNEVALLDKSAQRLVWSYPIGSGHECNCVDMTERGEVLFAYRSGARLVVPADNRVVWDFKAPEKSELHTARVLPDGGFLLAWCGFPAMIVELDKAGRVRKEIRFETGTKSLHGQFRQVTKLKNGHYLVPLMSQGSVLELDGNGTEIRRVKTGGGPFSVAVSRNGHWWVSAGDGHFLAEVDPVSGQVISRIGPSDVEGVTFQFVGETAPDGANLYIANWLGHSKDKTARKLVEIDADRRMVWSVDDEVAIPNVSSVRPVSKKMIKGIK